LKKYGGNDTWAVVSGGSDGMGLSFCKDLARQGFNICIIARNEQKINGRLLEIQADGAATGKKIKTRCVVAEFSDMTHCVDYERIASELKDIDIGLLFLNAGWGRPGPFKDLRGSEIQYMTTLNVLHPIYLCKALLPQLMVLLLLVVA